MHALPDGWPRISSSIVYDDPKAAIDWLCKAFGFEIRLMVEAGDGKLMHSELVYGEGVLMVGGSGGRPFYKSPRLAGGNTQMLMIYVLEDIEKHRARAVEHGAKIFQELGISDYGDQYWTDRVYGASDPEGHHFWFTQRLKTGDPHWSKVRNKVERSEHE
jgi:uncharacterized glyoxalase superfamily protein PhnB